TVEEGATTKVRKLQGCARMEGEFYPDEEPAKAPGAISAALKPWDAATRETLLSMNAKVSEGRRLDNLLCLFLGSGDHPALRRGPGWFPSVPSDPVMTYALRQRQPGS
ncbi:unnamed protein product, partial [Discosporangium mesarthrocarpum]